MAKHIDPDLWPLTTNWPSVQNLFLEVFLRYRNHKNGTDRRKTQTVKILPNTFSYRLKCHLQLSCFVCPTAKNRKISNLQKHENREEQNYKCPDKLHPSTATDRRVCQTENTPRWWEDALLQTVITPSPRPDQVRCSNTGRNEESWWRQRCSCRITHVKVMNEAVSSHLIGILVDVISYCHHLRNISLVPNTLGAKYAK